MDRLGLTNAIRQEAYSITESNLPFNVFPDRVRDIIFDLAHYENYNIEYCASVILSAAASAIGNACQIHIKGAWYNSPALYMTLVGRPGLGKTPPMGFLYKPLRDLDESRLNEYFEAMKAYEGTSGEGIGESPKLIKTVISDFTAEAMISAHYNNPRGVSVVVDEILGFFKSINRYNNRSNMIELFLTAYSGQPLDFIRKSEKYPTHIRHPCINLLGSVQTSLLGNVCCDEFESNGLLDRFLFVYPQDKRITEWSLNTSSLNDRPDIEGKWFSIIKNLLELPCLLDNKDNSIRPPFLEMESTAKECFYDWNNSIIRSVNSVSNDMEVESRKMKLNSNAGRIALILQLLKWASGEGHMEYVDQESVSGAIALIDYYEETYDRIKTLTQDNPQDGSSSWILRLNDEFTTRDAELAAMQAGLSRRSVYNALDRMSNGPNPILVKIGHGQYAKIHDSALCTFALSDKKSGYSDRQSADNKIVVNGYPKVQEKVQSAKVQFVMKP